MSARTARQTVGKGAHWPFTSASAMGDAIFGINRALPSTWPGHSPGEVRLRQLLLAAINEGASAFDFGIGEEVFKRRFATQVCGVQTWGPHPAPGATNATHSEPVHL